MIGIVAGTNRKRSRTLALAEIYAGLLKDRNVQAQVISLAELPEDFTSSALYENNGKNEGVNSLIARIRDCERLIFVIPEYNGSFPGVLKAFIDSFDYPSSLKNKKVALVGISSGDLGASLALSHFTDVLHYVGAQVLTPKVRFQAFDKLLVDGKIENPKYVEYLGRQADALLAF